MRKAILDVFSKDVDILNRWFICMSLLGGCLALMGARVSGQKACHIMGDWRRWSVRFASCHAAKVAVAIDKQQQKQSVRSHLASQHQVQVHIEK